MWKNHDSILFITTLWIFYRFNSFPNDIIEIKRESFSLSESNVSENQLIRLQFQWYTSSFSKSKTHVFFIGVLANSFLAIGNTIAHTANGIWISMHIKLEGWYSLQLNIRLVYFTPKNNNWNWISSFLWRHCVSIATYCLFAASSPFYRYI